MMRCACGRVIAGWCVIVTPEVDNAYPQGDDECPDRRQAPLEAARRADADQCPHEEAHVEGACLDEEAFEDVRMPAHMRPPQAAGFVEMCVRPFEMFAPPPLPSQPTRAADAPAMGIHRIPGHRLLLPVAPPAIRLGDVRPQIERPQIHQHLIAVIPLVGHRLGDHRLGDRRRVALIGTLDRHADDRAGLQVDRVLGLVREMRAPVFHLRDACIGVVRVAPVGVTALLRALPIHAREIGPRGRLDARRLGQPRQKLLRCLTRVAAHAAPQRRVGFKRCGIDPDRLSRDEIGRREHLQDPGKDRPVRLQIDQAPRPRNRRVLGWGLVQVQPQEAP